jgi:hypothetical protein
MRSGRILNENCKKFKTHKKTYMELLCITNLEYGGHGQEIQSSVSFCCKMVIFGKIIGCHLRSLSKNLIF